MNKVRSLRKMARKTVANTADCLGISVDTVSRIEHGDRVLSVDEACKLAVFFGCKATDFLPDNEDESENPLLPPSREGGKKQKPKLIMKDRHKRSKVA